MEEVVARKREIEVVIDSEGNVTMDAQGFEGRGCMEALDALSRGFPQGDKKKKKEFHVVATGRVRTR